MSSQNEIVQLSAIISSKIAEINDYIKSANLPEPSLTIDAPAAMNLPPHLVQAKAEAIVAMDDLKALIQGPVENLVQQTSPTLNVMPALDACVKYKIAQHLGVGEEISYQELSRRCGLEESMLRRLMRMLIAVRIFDEPRKGMIRHNGSSRLLHGDQQRINWLGYVTQTIWPASFFMVDAIEKWPDARELDQTAFQLLRGDTFWNWLKQDEVGAQRFTAAMDFLQNDIMFGTHHLVNSLNWDRDELRRPKLMVDIGGHVGKAASDILRRYPLVKCIVQDLPDVVGTAHVPQDLKDRLEFQEHNFFTPQPVEADVYLLRSILHDWPDKYAKQIISNLIPSLTSGAKLIVNEVCMPDPGTIPKSHESPLRGYDLCMKQYFNSKERDIEEWIALFRSCSERFQFSRLEIPPGSALAVIEFEWE